MSDLALFDFDGTLTTGETFRDFLGWVTPSRRIPLATVALAPLLAGYRLGWVSGVRIRAAVIRCTLAGTDAVRLHAQGRRYAAERIPALLRAAAVARLDWHRARGDRVIVVSGALDAYLAPWCHTQGLELLCSSLESRAGRLSGRYAGAQCIGEEKAARVRAVCDLASYGRVYAYGDTVEDEALLGLAHEAWYRGERRTGGVAN